MDLETSAHPAAAATGKKRIPKACSSCRQSKVKCDGQRPCSRCGTLGKECIFFQVPKDPIAERFENLELEVQRLNEQLASIQQSFRGPHLANTDSSQDVARQSHQSSPLASTGLEDLGVVSAPACQESQGNLIPSGDFSTTNSSGTLPTPMQNQISIQSLLQPGDGKQPSRKRSYSEFELQEEPISDIVSKGLVTIDRALFFFNTFFQGCNQILEQSIQAMMALDLGLPSSYEQLTQRLSTQDVESSGPQEKSLADPGEYTLMRRSRTWFGLLVLEHIFRVDAAKLPGIRSRGDIRRSRLLLNGPYSTTLDLRLLAQVELNVLRARINDLLNASTSSEGVNVIQIVQDAKIDLDVWFMDWSRIIEASPLAGDEAPFLLINVRIQRCWAEMMVQCKAIRYLGVENVAAMSTTERGILLMAKNSAKKHLKLVSTNSNHYLSTFKYAMDFVWAKCAFCFLLLLKLTQLVPESEEDSQQLLDGGNRLVQELSKVGSNSGSGSGNIYLQILKLSIEKYRRALREHEPETRNSDETPTSPFWESFNAQTDLQLFVPEQFIFEWDFPGLNLFYFPTTWQDFFGEPSLTS
ncbi:hypothetical protein FQN54_005882 [Arachnomyces sp. PD_36]|nr:hypothetical protein FQN54_005882 [Arachnomyces sp. PD_36]